MTPPHTTSLRTGAPDTAAPAPRPVALSWRTRDTTRHLLEAYIGSFGISLVTGVLLWFKVGGENLANVMLITHLAAGTLGLLFFVPYLFAHLKDGKEPWRTLLWPFGLLADWQWERIARLRFTGHMLMWTNWVLLLSGVVITAPAILHLMGDSITLPYGLSAILLGWHDLTTVLVLVVMAYHFPPKDRK